MKRDERLVPGTRTSILSKPSKMKVLINGKLMQVYSFGLTAGKTCIGATYKKNHKCNDCYAQKGSYLRWSTAVAQKQRTNWTIYSLNNTELKEQWVKTVQRAVQWATKDRNVPYFRIHDSGDFFSDTYIKCWIEIVKKLPDVLFWSPTSAFPEESHENATEVLKNMLPLLKEFAAQPNVVLRGSCREVGLHKTIPVEGFAASTGIITKKQIVEEQDYIKVFGVHVCPSHEHDNMCASCTHCWTEPDKETYYIKH